MHSYAEWGTYNNVKGLIVYKAKSGDAGYAYFNSKMQQYSGVNPWTDATGKSKPSYSTSNDTFIFFPAAGNGGRTYLENAGDSGYYWSSTLYTSDPNAYHLLFYSGNVYPQFNNNDRYYGMSVRPVSDASVTPAPTPTTTGTAKATIGGSEVDVNWVQLWAGGPKFAEYNVGVTDGKAESYGGYYCWGKSVNKDPNGDYNDGTVVLSGDDDTATNLWGGNWRMPTQTELQGLIDNCTVEWTTVGGKNGRKFTGKGAYASNSVFLPPAGLYNTIEVNGRNFAGAYWSSSKLSFVNAYYLDFYSDAQNVLNDACTLGLSVRAVLAEED